MDSDTTVLLIMVLAALAGTFFTVVPIIPGAIFPPAGAVLIGLVDGWGELRPWFWIVQGVLVVVYVLVDNFAQLIGVKRAGGSKSAMVGGAIGVFVGPILLAIVIGPFALLLGPPIGAVVGTIVGEERARAKLAHDAAVPRDHVRLGIGALVAYAVSAALKLVVIALQMGVLFLALQDF